MTTSSTEPKTKKKGPALWLSILIFIIGAGLAGYGALTAFNGALESITVDAFETPGSEVRELDPGDYEVFAASSGSFGGIEGEINFRADDITVTETITGNEIPVVENDFALDLTRGSTLFSVVGVFTVEESGTYEISVTGTDESLAVVARSFLTSFERVRIPLILLGIGALLSVIGVVMLLVGVIRRSRQDKQEQGPQTTTPGVYQQPPAQGAPPTPPPPVESGTSEPNTPWDG